MSLTVVAINCIHQRKYVKLFGVNDYDGHCSVLIHRPFSVYELTPVDYFAVISR